MSTLQRTGLAFLVAVAAILVDRMGFEPPTPPAWFLTWAGWIGAGWALTFGPRITRMVNRAQ